VNESVAGVAGETPPVNVLDRMTTISRSMRELEIERMHSEADRRRGWHTHARTVAAFYARPDCSMHSLMNGNVTA
jgi:hypothetical protein